MKDKQGREYAKLSDLKVGDTVQVDDGFTCMEPWSKKEVRQSSDGVLFVECSELEHCLDGQLADDRDSLIGIYKVT